MNYYIRYTDDFAIVAESREYLEKLLPFIYKFLVDKLVLKLHSKKIIIRSLHQGIDFLGYVLLPHHKVLRSKTKQRIFRKLQRRIFEYKSDIVGKLTLEQSLQSYLGVLSHANTYKVSQKLKNDFWFWFSE